MPGSSDKARQQVVKLMKRLTSEGPSAELWVQLRTVLLEGERACQVPGRRLAGSGRLAHKYEHAVGHAAEAEWAGGGSCICSF